MRIGFNCLCVDPSYAGGVNSYLFGLLVGFLKVGQTHEFVLFVTARNKGLFEKFLSHSNVKLVEVPEYHSVWRKGLARLGEESGSAFLYKLFANIAYSVIGRKIDVECDLLYTPTTYLFPLNCRIPTVVSVHDIQQVHYPDFFDDRELRRRHARFRTTANLSTVIQASSEFIKKDWSEHFSDSREQKVIVVPEGVNQSEFQPRNEKTKEVFLKYELPKKFLFFPAQLWHHKNHITVLKALKDARDQYGLNIPLVLTGQQYSSSQAILDYIRDEKLDFVFYLGKVPFSDLKALYAEAYFLITAVLYESSSLCVLEAAASGSPIIASDTPPNREMSEILEMTLFPPLDVSVLTKTLVGVWSDEGLAKKSAESNIEKVRYYSWENAAKKYLSFFEKVVAERSLSKL